MIKNVYWSSCKIPVILVGVEWNFNFLDKFLKKKNSNIKLHEIRPVGAELYRADRRKDRYDEANSRFSQFCERA